MIRKEVTVKLKQGINARPAAMLVQAASQFDSEIFIETDNRRMNAKSIMGMMALGLDSGEVVTVITDGSDEDEAFEKIENYLTSRED
ncbi:MAG: HPr family phosphocarrier protein [Lachnospiraceae bacterium]|nr:HPr family phosphocarrier protein [Lachnospiraceae bacterium]